MICVTCVPFRRATGGWEALALFSPSRADVRAPEGHVAYQVFGQGPRDIVFIPDHPNNIEIMWEDPALSRFLERLGAIGRVICFDKRGTGISDPVPLGALPTVERWMDDVTTVIDAVGCERIVVFGHGDGGPIAMLFAATYPERTEALVLGDTFARLRRAPDYPEGLDEVAVEEKARQLYDSWGRDDMSAPTDRSQRRMRLEPSFVVWRARFERLSLSPGALEMMYPVCDLDEVEDDRILATVLFTDIVGSTAKASRLGDREWRDLLVRHDALVRREIARFRGREIATAGDGFLALFDGPARASPPRRVRARCSRPAPSSTSWSGRA